jgi:murein DD-endopeptidase MepM/ murein hydrolase activator NlpD
VRGTVITAYRNAASPYASGQHRGIDIAAPVGTPAVSATAGSVRFVGRVGWSGLVVSIRTADGRYDTSYLHLSTIAVRRGQAVLRGQRVGAVGTTGRRSARQPHLHFGVRDAGTRRYHDRSSSCRRSRARAKSPRGRVEGPCRSRQIHAPARRRTGSSGLPGVRFGCRPAGGCHCRTDAACRARWAAACRCRPGGRGASPSPVGTRSRTSVPRPTAHRSPPGPALLRVRGSAAVSRAPSPAPARDPTSASGWPASGCC